MYLIGKEIITTQVVTFISRDNLKQPQWQTPPLWHAVQYKQSNKRVRPLHLYHRWESLSNQIQYILRKYASTPLSSTDSSSGIMPFEITLLLNRDTVRCVCVTNQVSCTSIDRSSQLYLSINVGYSGSSIIYNNGTWYKFLWAVITLVSLQLVGKPKEKPFMYLFSWNLLCIDCPILSRLDNV